MYFGSDSILGVFNLKAFFQSLEFGTVVSLRGTKLCNWNSFWGVG